ncbi:glycine betaine/L-proline ABC transporter permease [Escherichia coli]|uniref:Glycine betaine/L-proline ABC transporter permease n=1 Tax=Escherichia coli TaxID=562 RepID=A0A376RDW6_ECOLX|nr:glycine betaine/L-proline ABC transporter permease [Escherichia coli]
MADQNNPWDTTPAADSAVQSADAWGTPATAPTDGGGADWLTSTPAPNVEHFNILDPFHKTLIPLDSWVTEGSTGLLPISVPSSRACAFRLITFSTVSSNCCWVCPHRWRLSFPLSSLGRFPGSEWAWRRLVSLIAIGAIGAWSQAMVTLALVLTALLFCIVIGLPLGIWLARSPRAAKIIRPLLDAMQTTPAFVYLVPIVMLFGIGNVPGVVVTIHLCSAADYPSDHSGD